MKKPILAALLSVSGTSLTDDEKFLLEKANPLGVSLFGRNIASKEQLKKLNAEIKTVIGRNDVLIALDEEGGRVNRLKPLGYEYAWAKALGNSGSEQMTKLHCKIIAQDMLELGANLNFAPVLDIEYEQTTIALKGRCLSSDAKIVADLGRIMWQTYAQSGVCPCLKHLPGHGRAYNDPHLQLPAVTCSLTEMEKDFYPFIKNNDCPMAMTAHILITELDNQNPITFSKRGIDEIIRSRIGFNGFLLSDALEMNALKGSVTERATAAWSAGCDAVCYCNGNIHDMQNLCRNAQFLTDIALERFNNVKNVLQNQKKSIQSITERELYKQFLHSHNIKEINYDATEILHQMQQGEK